MDYYNNINNNYKNYISDINWNKIELLGNIGNPYSQEYTFNNTTYKFSPTILRYIQFTFDILTHIKNNTELNELNIVEIGGGFGFQSILLYELAYLFNIKVTKYTIVDLKYVCNLQNTFIKQCNKVNNKETAECTKFGDITTQYADNITSVITLKNKISPKPGIISDPLIMQVNYHLFYLNQSTV